MKLNFLAFQLILLVKFCHFKTYSQDTGKHLFVLSGQSNMAKMKPDDVFIPTLHNVFGGDKVLVVKHAQGGQPIRRWVKDWKNIKGEAQEVTADLYQLLIAKVKNEIQNQPITTVTFIWMQGERDAREGHGAVYKSSLKSLYKQLSSDLNREDIHFIIGRLSDFDLNNRKYPHWTMIRNIQVDFANSDLRFDWIDTDDLNDGTMKNGKKIENGLHMTKTGYRTMAERFAQKAIDRIKKQVEAN